MKSRRFKQCLGRLGMSQVGAALFLEIDPRQVRRLIAGTRDISAPVAMLLELMVYSGIDPNKARTIAGLKKIDGLNRPAGRPPKKPKLI